MEWSKTKTMFIIVFLILDLFLATQLFNKYSKSQIEFFPSASDEESLKADEISYDSNAFSKDKITSQYVRAKSTIFTEKDLKRLENQSAIITKDGTDITSYFEKPIKINGQINEAVLDKFVNEKVLNGNLYSFWKYDKDTKQIIYFQTYKNKKIYKNINGHIIFYLNDKNEIVSYEQTLLNIGADAELKEGEVLPAIKVMNTLHNKGMLKRNSKVLAPELGYYTRIQSSELQLLVPTWHFTVEHNGKKEDFFVDAIEGQIFQMKDSLTIDSPSDSQSDNDPSLKGDIQTKSTEPGDF